jgi:hypothetical protein
MHPPPERRQDGHAPVAQLVAEALDHDRAVVRDGPGGFLLVRQVGCAK